MGALFLHFATTDVHRLIIAGTAAVRVSHAPHVTPSPVKTSIEQQGSGCNCATSKSNADKAVAQFLARAIFVQQLQFAKSGMVRLIVVIATAVPMSQAPRA